MFGLLFILFTSVSFALIWSRIFNRISWKLKTKGKHKSTPSPGAPGIFLCRKVYYKDKCKLEGVLRLRICIHMSPLPVCCLPPSFPLSSSTLTSSPPSLSYPNHRGTMFWWTPTVVSLRYRILVLPNGWQESIHALKHLQVRLI